MDKKQWQNCERPDEMLMALTDLGKDSLEELRSAIEGLVRGFAQDVITGYCTSQTPQKIATTEVNTWAEQWTDMKGTRDRKLTTVTLEAKDKNIDQDVAWAIRVGTAVQDYDVDNDLMALCKSLESGVKLDKFHGMSNLVRMVIPEWPGK